jgi:PEP-CTERM motif
MLTIPCMCRFQLMLLSAMFLFAGSAGATQIPVFSTGVDDHGNPLQGGSDPHWMVMPVQGWVVSNPASLFWLENQPGAQWISYTPAGTGPFTGDYQYITGFNLAGIVPSTASIDAQIASYSGATVELNGVTVCGDPSGLPSQSFPCDITSGFKDGWNQLSVEVYSPTYETGLLFDITSATGTATPEPGSLGMLLIGAAGLAVAVCRRWNRRSAY